MIEKFIKMIPDMLITGKRYILYRVIFVGFISLPVLLIASTSFFHIYREYNERILANKRTQAYLASTIVHERLNGLISFGVSLATRPFLIQEIRKGNWENGIHVLDNLLTNFTFIDRISLLDTAGNIRAVIPNGVSTVVGQNRSDKNWYQTLSNRWEPFISDVYVRGGQPKVNIISLVVPIKSSTNFYLNPQNRNTSKDVIGILHLQIKMNTFKDWISGADVGTSGIIYLVDRNGNLVFHPNYDTTEKIINYSDLDIVGKLKKGISGAELNYNSYEKVMRIAGYSPVKEFGWGIVVTQPVGYANKERNEYLHVLALTYGISIMCVVFVSFLLIYALVQIIRSRKEIENQKSALLSEITERKQVEELLRANEERLQLAIRAGNIGIWDWDIVTNGMTWDASMYKLYGIPRGNSAITYETWRGTLHPEERGYVDASIRNAINGEREFDPEFRIIRQDGEIRIIKAASRTFKDMYGRAVRMIGTNIDITERKHIEGEMAKRNRELSILFELTNTLIQSLDLDIMLKKSLNTVIMQMGFDGGGVYLFEDNGNSMSLHAAAGLSDEFLDNVSNLQIDEGLPGRVVAEGKVVVTLFEDYPESRLQPYIAREGLHFMAGSPLMAGGETLGVLIAAMRKPGKFTPEEEHILQIIGQLLGTAVQNAKLYTHITYLAGDLKRSNKDLDDFAFIASHDLKEPLRSISNYSNFLMEDYRDKLDAEGVRMIKVLIDQSTRLEKFLTALLRFSRVGREQLSLEMVNLNETIEKVKEDLDFLFKSDPSCTVECFLDNVLPVLKSDPVFIREIFMNLMSNAVKYNARSEKTIHIGVLENHNGFNTVLYVRDNGIGIHEKHFEDIFKIFKRLHARDKFGGGTGAGLTIVKKMIQSLKGTIWLESKANEGTTFYFTINGGN